MGMKTFEPRVSLTLRSRENTLQKSCWPMKKLIYPLMDNLPTLAAFEIRQEVGAAACVCTVERRRLTANDDYGRGEESRSALCFFMPPKVSELN